MTQTTVRIAEALAAYVTDQSQILEIIKTHDTLEHANEVLRRLTGIRCFFPDHKALEEFEQALHLPLLVGDPRSGREWGDFQTPLDLAGRVCRYLAETGVAPRTIIEPTCGTGSFVLAALDAFPMAELVYGVEVQEQYHWQLRIALLMRALQGRRSLAEIELHRDDVFVHRFSTEVRQAQNTLIIGNPPWVTSAELGVLQSRNAPPKRNVKALSGLDAVTGKSNFDLGEAVILRILDLFSRQRGTLAMLCKNSVTKNVIEGLPQRQYTVSNARALAIDAKHEFGAAVKASLFVLDMGMAKPTYTCQVAALERPQHVMRTFGWTHSHFVSDIQGYDVGADLG